MQQPILRDLFRDLVIKVRAPNLGKKRLLYNPERGKQKSAPVLLQLCAS